MNSIGLAVGTNRIVVVMVEKKLTGDPFLEHYRVVSLKEVNPEDREEIILSNTEGFIDEHRGDRDNFFLVIPGSAVIFKRLSLPSPTEENLREVLGFEIDRYTPFTVEDVYFDFKIIERDESKKLIHVLLVVVKKEVVDYYLGLFQRIRIKVRGIEVAATALSNVVMKEGHGGMRSVDKRWVVRGSEWLSTRGWGKKLILLWDRFLRKEDRENTTPVESVQFLVNIDDESCELGMVRDSRLVYSRYFPVSLGDGDAGDGGAVKELVDQVLSEIATTQLTLTGETPEVTQLTVAGNKADQNFMSDLQGREHIDARLLDDPSVKISAGNATEKIPCLSAAIGVALKGLKRVALDINLIPRELRPKRKMNWNLIFGVTAVMVLLLGISSYTVAFFIKERMYLTELTERMKALKGGVEEVEKMQREIAEIEGKIDSLEKIKTDDVGKLKILKELTEIIPEQMWLTQFSYTERKSVREIDLSGYADTASELIPLLEKSKFFEDVKFKSSIVKDRSSNKEKFNVTAVVSSK